MKQIIFLLLAAIFLKTEEGKNVKVGQLKSSYSLNDSIALAVQNSAADTMFYYIGVEAEQKGDWQEIINDISNPKVKSSKIMRLVPGQNADLTYDLKKVFIEGQPSRGKFRIKVSYGTSVMAIDSAAYSAPFSMKK